MRGEYVSLIGVAGFTVELPPRARRIPNPCAFADGVHGTTSACAENTSPRSGHRQKPGNYLRVRGEYFVGGFDLFEQQELPPRARRILLYVAEETYPPRNYLRVRGEYSTLAACAGRLLELPPRARRIRSIRKTSSTNWGTTSACAENTHHQP